jgi:hypothetical protein
LGGCLRQTNNKNKRIERLKAQIDFQRKQGNNKLADLLAEDLAKAKALQKEAKLGDGNNIAAEDR